MIYFIKVSESSERTFKVHADDRHEAEMAAMSLFLDLYEAPRHYYDVIPEDIDEGDWDGVDEIRAIPAAYGSFTYEYASEE